MRMFKQTQLSDRQAINALLLRLVKIPKNTKARTTLQNKIVALEEKYKDNYGYNITYHWQK